MNLAASDAVVKTAHFEKVCWQEWTNPAAIAASPIQMLAICVLGAPPVTA
jgi:hypothetical protein